MNDSVPWSGAPNILTIVSGSERLGDIDRYIISALRRAEQAGDSGRLEVQWSPRDGGGATVTQRISLPIVSEEEMPTSACRHGYTDREQCARCRKQRVSP